MATQEEAQKTAQEKIFFDADVLRRFAEGVLFGNGVPQENATIIASALISADLRGVDTHGINRIPSYMERIRRGVLDPKAVVEVKRKTAVAVGIDGNNGFGFVAAERGIAECIEMAKTYGIGMASIKHSNHFGMAAWIVQKALNASLLSLVFTNSSPALPIYGGSVPLMGVSPIACGAPGPKDGIDFILDMAPSVAARGKIYKALRRGDTIPDDWALDKDGRRTIDPAKALEGVMLPMGGSKGSALAVMMDVFSGVLSGSAFAGDVAGPYDASRKADVGHFMVAIRPDLWLEGGEEEFRCRMGVLYDKCVGSEKAEGVERIWFPGEIEIITADERRRNGIPFVRAEVEALNKEAERVGVEPLVMGN